MFRFVCTMLISLLLVTACESSNTDNNANQVTESSETEGVDEIIKKDKNTDLFMLNGIVYVNAESIQWVQDYRVENEKIVGAIRKQYRGTGVFENEMSTQLPIGTNIYSPMPKPQGGLFLIVKVNDKSIRYIGLTEG